MKGGRSEGKGGETARKTEKALHQYRGQRVKGAGTKKNVTTEGRKQKTRDRGKGRGKQRLESVSVGRFRISWSCWHRNIFPGSLKWPGNGDALKKRNPKPVEAGTKRRTKIMWEGRR